MRYITLLLLCGGIAQAALAQQITLDGQVTIHNSRYRTGQIEYVKGAYATAPFTTPGETADNGMGVRQELGLTRLKKGGWGRSIFKGFFCKKHRKVVSFAKNNPI